MYTHGNEPDNEESHCKIVKIEPHNEESHCKIVPQNEGVKEKPGAMFSNKRDITMKCLSYDRRAGVKEITGISPKIQRSKKGHY